MSTASDVPARNTTPNGCVVGLAEEIVQAIGRCEYGKKKNRFALMVWSSFKLAGYQNGRPDAGLRYFFDMQKVCQELGLCKQSVARIRRQLEADGLFTYTPNENDYATGWLVWSPAYLKWAPLQPNALRHGGSRSGAGNPNWTQATVNHLKAPADKTSNRKPLESKTAEESLSSGLRSPAVTPFKRFTLPSREAAPMQVAIDESKKGTEEEYTEEETYLAADAAQGILLSVPVALKPTKQPRADDSTKARKPDPLWDKAAELFGFSPRTKSGRGAWNAALKDLREVDATPEDLQRVYEAWPNVFQGARCSLNAIAKHFDDLLHALDAQIGTGDYYAVPPEYARFVL